MRLIHIFHEEETALQFSLFLRQKHIENNLEAVPPRQYRIWILEEDQADAARTYLENYLQNPEVIKDTTKPTEEEFKETIPLSETPLPPMRSQPPAPITFYLIFFCTLLLALTQISAPSFEAPPTSLPPIPFLSSPTMKALYYDYPEAYETLDKLIHSYGAEKIYNPAELPTEARYLLNQYSQTPVWEGFYGSFVTFFKTSHFPPITAPLFEKIKAGEVWRLITPIFLHNDIFHLLFNMIWLFILGRQMEPRLRPLRYLLFILLAAIFSNTAQYLMGGFRFIGFSGVLSAMIVFVWFRQKRAPWEGYQLFPSTMAFVSLFILFIAGLQLVSFFLEIHGYSSIAPSIANTAHLSGALIGYIFSFLPFFSRRKI